MTEEPQIEPQKLGPLPGETAKDYASRRLVDLKNSERQFMSNLQQAQISVERANADLIACRGRIDEMLLIIKGDKSEKDSPSTNP